MRSNTSSSRVSIPARESLGGLRLLSRVIPLAWLLCGGCAHGANASAPLQEGTLDSGGKTRSFIYRVPGDKGPHPLVIALHGRLGQGRNQEQLSHLAELSAREGFIVVVPDGVRRSWADARGVTPASQQGVDDVRFVSDLIDHFVKTAGADPARVYVIGMSNGGIMAVTLACRLSERITAVASVTGGMPESLGTTCAPSRPVPIAFFMGDQDPFMPYAGGALGEDRGRVLPSREAAARWAALDGCAAGPALEELPDVDPQDGTRVERATWKDCHGGAEVRLYTVKGGGHTWPGGTAYARERLIGRTSRDLDASREAWELFSRFTAKPRGSGAP
ncbi:dienelactone hydrolase family protein [Pyxidicoccus parkwayensis]|uniref:Dienelactone hydrolase family protein n=1 Tax=Pyxidicoccus parkwayensis TaxID=2813578 RepID=A0ABX7NJZ6_9BACT|nr:alpha/beta fold hydrolase [Pyxidicoccus parkwaysis]QSQ19100.1 dienelactone hydrolase family protein [Pyxidicoccus parkwaysis]